MNPSQIHKVQQTVLEMWTDQQYNYTQYETNPDTPDLLYLDDTKSTLLIAHFIMAPKVRPNLLKKAIQNFEEQYEEVPYQLDIVLIIKEKPNSLLTNLIKKYPNVVLYWFKQLTYNLTKHRFVPQHKLLTESEQNELMEYYSLRSFKELPILLSSDPICKYYKFKRGDVCKITRNDCTSGQSISYRYVQ